MSVLEPSKILTPWATSGLKNQIPQTANPVTGNAGYDQGFPAINMTPKEAGGIPPFGQDFNGIFFAITEILQYMQAGGMPTYSANMSTSIGGYPLGALLLKSSGLGMWRNTIASNTSNPDAGGSGWLSDSAGNYAGATEIVAPSTSLTPAQAGQAFLFTTASATVALPNGGSVAPGGVFKLQTSAGFTLSVTGGGAMKAGSALVTSLSVPAGTELLAVCNGSVWWVFGTALVNSLGIGQTWQNVTSSRSAGVTYTNTTGRTIAVKVSAEAYSNYIFIQSGGSVEAIQSAGRDSAVSVSSYAEIDLIIPPGGTYSIALGGSSPLIRRWSELR